MAMLPARTAADYQWVESLAGATRSVCAQGATAQFAGAPLLALRASVEQACGVPAAFAWEHKAAAHAGIFNVLADLAADPHTGAVLSGGVGVAYDLMMAVGPVAGGITVNSRRCFLACLRRAEWVDAAHEMEKHLRILHFLGRLAGPGQ
jgi:hypothetical protein